MIFLIYSLLKQANKLNKETMAFFRSVEYEDFSFKLKGKTEKSYRNLSTHLDALNHILSNTRIDHEIQSQYLQTIIGHINVGLITIKPGDKVEFFNPAAQKILQLYKVGKIQAITDKYPELGNILKSIKPGQQKLIKLKTPEKIKHLTLKASSFYSKNQPIKLVSFQDIQYEMEENEAETWKKLIRVLTHEINNSISPILSLTDSLNDALEQTVKPDPSLQGKAHESLKIIKNRSQGLLGFVEKFRNLTPKNQLNKEVFSVRELFYRVRIISGEYKPPDTPIKIEATVYPVSLELKADIQYVEQILINLAKNAMEAITSGNQGVIQFKAFRKIDQIVLEIRDNGIGIDSEERDKIFTPFYTTKEKGSGIGLSLARQIMLMHGGNISVHSEPGKLTVFTLEFPAYS
jgi:nitrogen fixation/metabolism regulation signal transduction histidine kinase